MTDEEREKLDAWARRMAELDPGLCASAGGEPYREFIGPRPVPRPVATPEPPSGEPAPAPELPAPGTA